MSADLLLARCRALGIDLAPGPDGALLWEADIDPPAELLADLKLCKAELLRLLTRAGAALAEVLALIDQLESFRPGSALPEVLRDVVTGYHHAGDPLLYLAAGTVRRILANLAPTDLGPTEQS
jgi:hypothetical protein